VSITVLAAHDLARLADRLDPTTTILFEDRVDLASRLVELAALPRLPRTLDLVGLTGNDHLLTFHARALDGENRLVRAFWREIAELDLVARLGIESVRLIGCSSAVGPRARATIAMLSDVLGVPVIGSYELVSFDDFRGSFEFPETTRTGAAFLDLDSLRARPADAGARIITAAMGRDLLAQIRRRNGVHLPDLLARSSASLAIPSAVDGLFHHVEVMLDHELVRTGDVVFPVDDPRGLRLLLD
jgi:hypothetical protein